MSEYLDTSCMIKLFKENEEYYEESYKKVNNPKIEVLIQNSRY